MVVMIDKLKIFKDSVGLFVIADYSTPNGIDTAMGQLESVSDDGDIVIRHLSNTRVFWGFNLSKVENYKFSPIKQKDGAQNGC